MRAWVEADRTYTRRQGGARAIARITVVNDNADFLGLMGEILAERGDTPTTIRGEEATVDDIAASDPDLIVVDLRLTDASVLNDGWAIVVGVRAHPRLAEVPIIVCSADQEYLSSRAGEIAALADVHPLAKPFGIADLEGLIEQLLDR